MSFSSALTQQPGPRLSARPDAPALKPSGSRSGQGLLDRLGRAGTQNQAIRGVREAGASRTETIARWAGVRTQLEAIMGEKVEVQAGTDQTKGRTRAQTPVRGRTPIP